MATLTGPSIQILSDLHLENPVAYDMFEIPQTAPTLALIGDIGHVNDEGLFQFLRKQLQAFETVLFLLGNHEPYNLSRDVAISILRSFEALVDRERQSTKSLGRFVLLDRNRFDLSPNVTVLGCTLHSRIDSAQTDHVSFGLNDFYYIEDWTVDKHTDAHVADLAWLDEQVSSLAITDPEKRIVILTHHSPTLDPRSIDPAHTASKVSSGFMTDLSSTRCWMSPKVVLWAFGHTHFNCDFIDETTGKRVFTNQRGYYFSAAAHLDLEKVITFDSL
ncbi:hypothetical protein BDV97DRAFT_297100 [Delphinella strobiligena]|nr:hypothetical protein BDV97DRAFT_297100 [Delphinella strobiligena]